MKSPILSDLLTFVICRYNYDLGACFIKGGLM